MAVECVVFDRSGVLDAAQEQDLPRDSDEDTLNGGCSSSFSPVSHQNNAEEIHSKAGDSGKAHFFARQVAAEAVSQKATGRDTFAPARFEEQDRFWVPNGDRRGSWTSRKGKARRRRRMIARHLIAGVCMQCGLAHPSIQVKHPIARALAVGL
jgi:hypothetical protein